MGRKTLFRLDNCEFNPFNYEPHKDEHYFDEDGKRITLEKLCMLEPLWAANVIRSLKTKLHKKCCGTINGKR